MAHPVQFVPKSRKQLQDCVATQLQLATEEATKAAKATKFTLTSLNSNRNYHRTSFYRTSTLCLPLGSILLALGNPPIVVDYLSLDVGGGETESKIHYFGTG